ncbi:protein PFC0760c-like [Chrysoperla carnea]|uniref:protein PFC0760c-like n=1 Tax=Chrysoperla carnea TaxID=189513 RepID=UPI001D0635FC|nr:protein PFC0760c-like [Chrysoperla carnea]
MEGGRTAHSALQLPLNIAEQQFPIKQDNLILIPSTSSSLENDTNEELNKDVNIDSNKSRKEANKLPNESDKDKNNISNESGGHQDLRKLLKASLVGRYLLKKVNCLDASDRCDLVRIIIEHQMLNTLKIKRDTFIYWTDQIVTVFPKEKSDTYYIPYKNDETVASGKLYDKFTNLRRKLLSIDISDNKSNEEDGEDNETDDLEDAEIDDSGDDESEDEEIDDSGDDELENEEIGGGGNDDLEDEEIGG